ncbi:MAG TPA: hypothetical protein DCQ26_12810 [Marinilabiliales bacterium]|jgi:serine phosphatase RsbU (regulator of sigma subunit)|nr:MAG: hypothetical protein A2W95_08845 [Bacteroidetes bacterium GWA2_40_14]OFX65719.1 MAG: hypothetical protein A2W84_15930 [Bacteroidetes bacterium GWC2_40_13]OFX75974.1 MAG: hypothetical protein A2W96_00785 [Bacteroidetes bacterium GWD2_40_43]OFX94412.1 MAG: hypothetical protein A2W97_19835 [Bacteroidetes bacterium GWE2_40_63]OFY18890.1 MAG: hypothetical protein A2W88_06605 [Bacteroidetes bacterium GWF2_40_13]OFZ28885.1 MAG: hypothetical protein A2437_13340 [Bacteroidetes bacterium RIFOXYC
MAFIQMQDSVPNSSEKWILVFLSKSRILHSFFEKNIEEFQNVSIIEQVIFITAKEQLEQWFTKGTHNIIISFDSNYETINELVALINSLNSLDERCLIYKILWYTETDQLLKGDNILLVKTDDIRCLNNTSDQSHLVYFNWLIQKLNASYRQSFEVGHKPKKTSSDSGPIAVGVKKSELSEANQVAWNMIEQQKIEIEQRNKELELAFKKSSIQHIKLQKIFYQNEMQRKELEQALIEIQKKNEELATQNEEISTQRDQIELQNEEIQSQRDFAILQQEEIRDNLLYASRIQQALLPPKYLMEQLLPEHFVLNRPKDIVSGDFYWISQNRFKTIVAVADCTGHGISGAMMSMLGTAFLNEIINRNDITNSAQILDQLRERIIISLHQENENNSLEFSRDGMDISLCIIDIVDNTLEFSGANNPLYLVRDQELMELKADKIPIGIHEFCNEPYATQKLELKGKDEIYLFSDGFADQFGGSKGKKMKYTRFKQIILESASVPFHQKEWALDTAFNEWKGNQEQIDDVLVLGFKIN